MTEVYLHADDFGMNIKSSKRMLECYTQGDLNSLSILVNGCYKEAFELIRNTSIKIRLHLNLVEGKCTCGKEKVPLLVDKDGYFKRSFVGIFLLLLSTKRKQARIQIKMEIENQMDRFLKLTKKEKLDIDSHQHIHMIPSVFHIICEILKEKQLIVENMRIPAEPIRPFIKYPSLYPTYKVTNIIKTLLLNIFYQIIKKDIRKLRIDEHIFMGIMFSGCMDQKRLLKVLPDFLKISKKKGTFLEVLFHPGYINTDEPCLDKKKKGFLKFYCSKERKIEEDTLKTAKIWEKIRYTTYITAKKI